MRADVFVRSAVVALTLLTPALAPAETRADVYNGGTCVPYPPFNSSNAVPYSYWLYGFRESAHCHFTMPGGWDVTDLSYVLFTGRVPAGSPPIRVRLCVYRTGAAAVCGAERTLTSSMTVNWVAPPGTLPTAASGAYLYVRFPPDRVTLFEQFIPAWSR